MTNLRVDAWRKRRSVDWIISDLGIKLITFVILTRSGMDVAGQDDGSNQDAEGLTLVLVIELVGRLVIGWDGGMVVEKR